MKHPVEDGLAQIPLSPASVQYYRLRSILHLAEYVEHTCFLAWSINVSLET